MAKSSYQRLLTASSAVRTPLIPLCDRDKGVRMDKSLLALLRKGAKP
jgi:hypothetical protein